MSKTDLLFVNMYFEPAPMYRGKNPRLSNMTDSLGKHILEHYKNRYMEKADFQKLMNHYNIHAFKNKYIL